MLLLEYYQNQHYFNEHYVPRKTQIPLQGDINLYGVRGCGKSAMVLDYIQEEPQECTLYIDMEDPNLIFASLAVETLQKYIDKMQIKLLVLDHYTQNALTSFPSVERLIVVTRIKLHHTSLDPLELFPLDYEEFLAFEGSVSATNAFNHFLKTGTLPQMAKLHKSNTSAMKIFMQSRFEPNEQKLLLILAQHHTQHLTVHQIYNFAKEKFKVSKDWLYKTIKAFGDEKLLFFIEDRYQKSGKKMLLFDFAFAKYFTTGQPFMLQFDNMVALAMVKHHIIFETLGNHGYLTQEDELVIAAPFESEESFWVKSQNKFSLYKKYGIRKVTIVTVANQYEFHIKNIHFEALPFYEWSILNEE
ncbi:MAG TPA: hypothetical protein CFH81_07230 [Sulfurovum sp. UBA12169]|nr:MAG TPA: hypothetical protein CFH81_07230 [Sulfurovum sp. UBA12169]